MPGIWTVGYVQTHLLFLICKIFLSVRQMGMFQLLADEARFVMVGFDTVLQTKLIKDESGSTPAYSMHSTHPFFQEFSCISLPKPLSVFSYNKPVIAWP